MALLCAASRKKHYGTLVEGTKEMLYVPLCSFVPVNRIDCNIVINILGSVFELDHYIGPDPTTFKK